GRILSNPDPNQPRLGVDGMMAGYVLLTGEHGLQQIVDKKLRVPDRIDVEVLSTMTTLRFLWEYVSRVPRTDILKAMRLLLDDPKYAGSVIVDLARWQDWEIAPQIIANYGKPPFDDLAGKQRVIQFALTAQKHLSKQENPPKSLADVRAFLDRIRRDEPDVVRSAERFLGSPGNAFPGSLPNSAPNERAPGTAFPGLPQRKPLEGNLDDRP